MASSCRGGHESARAQTNDDGAGLGGIWEEAAKGSSKTAVLLILLHPLSDFSKAIRMGWCPQHFLATLRAAPTFLHFNHVSSHCSMMIWILDYQCRVWVSTFSYCGEYALVIKFSSLSSKFVDSKANIDTKLSPVCYIHVGLFPLLCLPNL